MSGSTQIVGVFSDYKARFIRAFGTSCEGKELHEYPSYEKYVGDTEYVYFELPKQEALRLVRISESGRF